MTQKRKYYKTCQFTHQAMRTYEYKTCSGEDQKEEKHADWLFKLLMKNRSVGLTKREWKYFKNQHHMYNIGGREMREMGF